MSKATFNWAQSPFFIHKMDGAGRSETARREETSFPVYGFLFLTDGELLAEAGGQTWLCHTGQLLLIPEGMPFRVLPCRACSGYAGGFSARLRRDAALPCLHRRTPLLHSYWFDQGAEAGLLFRQMYRAFVRKDPGYVSRALDLLLYRIGEAGEEATHPTVRRFLERVFAPEAKLPGVAVLADEMHVSPGHLNKLVRIHTKHSAMEWIEISRLNRAKQLLREGGRPISEVAESVGFEDTSYFSRFFKKPEGCSPRAYRTMIEKS